MHQSEYANIFALESTHFYYRSTHQLILSLITKYLPRATCHTPLSILDAGCGTGLLATHLSRFGPVIGLDSSPLAIKYSRHRGIDARLGSLTKLPFKANSFAHDTLVHTRHRYSKSQLAALLTKFTVLKLSYVNPLLLFPAIISMFLGSPPRSSISPLPKLLNKFLLILLGFENQELTFE